MQGPLVSALHLLLALLVMPATPLPVAATRRPAMSRRQAVTSLLGVSSILVNPLSAQADFVETRAANLEKMEAAALEKDKLCAGRRGGVDYEVGFFDMTFDPPCYVSGYYEVGLYAVIVAVLKLASEFGPDESEEGKLYSTLGVKRDASFAEIKQGYKAQARQWHPDAWTGASDAEQKKAEEQFKTVVEAYNLLTATGRRSSSDIPSGRG